MCLLFLYIFFTSLLYMGAGAGAESWSFVKFMLNFWELKVKKNSAIQLNGIAQGRETTYKT